MSIITVLTFAVHLPMAFWPILVMTDGPIIFLLTLIQGFSRLLCKMQVFQGLDKNQGFPTVSRPCADSLLKQAVVISTESTLISDQVTCKNPQP